MHLDPATIEGYLGEIHRTIIFSYMVQYMKLPKMMCNISLPDQTHHSHVPRELLYQHSVGNEATLHILLSFCFNQILWNIYILYMKVLLDKNAY